MESKTDAAARRARDFAGQAWADVADLLDLQLSPLGLRAIEALSPQLGEAVLDVGCGAGQSTLQLAERVGEGGKVQGVDIAPTLLTIARRRAARLPQVDFIECDAQMLALPSQSFDCVYSRFGVMALSDPSVAFSNFRRMLRAEGRLAFVCWRAYKENELDELPLRAAGLEAQLDSTPFRFADPDYIRPLLESAGFRNVSVDSRDERVSSGGLEAMLEVLLRVGPLGKILRENPSLKPAAETRVRAALAEREDASVVALNAATWVITAEA